MNKRKVWEKDKYLVQQKGYTVKKNTWKSKEILKNAMKLIEEFKREYRQEEKNEMRQ